MGDWDRYNFIRPWIAETSQPTDTAAKTSESQPSGNAVSPSPPDRRENTPKESEAPVDDWDTSNFIRPTLSGRVSGEPSQPVHQAKSLEEGLAAAGEYEGDPLECPCIKDLKEGPCGPQFVVAYRCFLDSKEEEKGADCIDSFHDMQQCFNDHPELYDEYLRKGDEDPKAGGKTGVEAQGDDDLAWERNNFKRN